MPASKSNADLHFPSFCWISSCFAIAIKPSWGNWSIQKLTESSKGTKISSSRLPHSSGKVPFKILNPGNEELHCLIHESILMAWMNSPQTSEPVHSGGLTGRQWESAAPPLVWKQPSRRDPTGRAGGAEVLDSYSELQHQVFGLLGPPHAYLVEICHDQPLTAGPIFEGHGPAMSA